MLSSAYLLLAAAFNLVRFVSGTNNNNNNSSSDTGNFTVINGQVFTPGLVVVDAPQPFTPLGGDFLQVALDITGSGRLPWPKNPANSPTVIHNITLFLTSYITGRNFTISNATVLNNTSSAISPPLTSVLFQEPSSTVKHVNWLWPSCLVGNGPPSSDNDSARGPYNISIHQSYRLNNSDYYTIFDLPINVINLIPSTPSNAANRNDPDPGPVSSSSSDGSSRVACDLLQNHLLDYAVVNASVNAPVEQPYLGGGVVVSGSSSTGVGASGKGGKGGTGGNEASGIDSTSSASDHGKRWSGWSMYVGLGLISFVIPGAGFI